MQIVFPIVITILAFSLFGKACQFKAVVVLHLIGVVGIDMFGLSEGVGYAVLPCVDSMPAHPVFPFLLIHPFYGIAQSSARHLVGMLVQKVSQQVH